MKLSRKQWIPIGILLLFIITNPSISAFKAYVGSNTYSGLKRTTNLFVCSLYKHSGNKYFAIVGNFFEIDNTPMVTSIPVPSIDSTKIPDSDKMRSSDVNDLPLPPRKKIIGYTSVGLPIFEKK